MATDEFGKLFKRAWGDKDFTALTVEQQSLYHKLISQPDISLAGVLTLAPVRWARQTAGQTVETIEDTLDQLEAARFVVVDKSTQEVLVRSYIRRDLGWRSPRTMKGIAGAVERILSSRLRVAVARELDRIDTSGLSEQVSEKTNRSTRQVVEETIASLIADTPSDTPSDTPCDTPSHGVSDTPSDTPCDRGSLTRADNGKSKRNGNSNGNSNPSLRSGGAGGGLSAELATVSDSTAVAKAPANAKTKRGTRLPDGWFPDRTDAALKLENTHDRQWLARELDRFPDYWQAKTGRDATKLDWTKTWCNWLRNAEDHQTRNHTTGPDWNRWAAEARAEDEAERRQTWTENTPSQSSAR
jgi:hypothetical protein